MKLYKIRVHEPSDIIYEDESITVKLSVADLRDPGWFIGVDRAYNKLQNNTFRLTKKQEHFLYRRIAFDLKQELFHEKYGFIYETDYNSDEDNINILEVQ